MESTENKNYTGSGQGNLNTVLGAIGTAGFLGLLNGTGIGIGGRPPAGDPPWARDMNYERELTEKDSEIGQLKAQQYADAAVLAAERRLADKIEKLETSTTAAFTEQGKYNVANTAAVASINNQVAQLMSMTGIIINGPAMAASQAAASAFTAKTANAGGNSGN